MAVRSTFLGIEVSKRGLAVSQKGLDITSNNVANINTPGYTRQRVDISSVNMSGSYRYPTGSIDNAGQGSQVDGIAQIRNKFLDVRFRDSNSNTGYYEQQVSILTGVQNAIDEISSDGLLTVYQEAMDAIQNLSLNPNDSVYAATAKSAVNNVSLILQQFDKSLRDVAEQQIYDTSVIIDSANTCLDKIATINKALLLESNNELSNVYSSNELNDQLNYLIDELSEYANIDVTWEDDTTVTIKINGHTVVEGAWCDKLQLNEHNNSTIDVIYKSSGEQASFSGGSIKANTDYINGDSSVTKGIQYYIHRMDDFAVHFAGVMNNTIQEYKLDEDGNQILDANGDPVVQYKTLIQTNDGTDTITAGNITISDIWRANESYIINDRPEGTNQNTSFLQLISKMEGDLKIDNFQGSLEEFIETLNTDVGEDIVFAKSRYDACQIITTDLDNSRDEISGVSYDEEGANLIMYEKAYSAMARVMTAMDEVLEKLINGTGLVGR
ncbi:MAG: flagellar hook-associated protein FlgK [Erysipelotrichales bacterium]|nr:flagellar hook-associated protein FlgK [Erysipelotrichales bacterium]